MDRCRQISAQSGRGRIRHRPASVHARSAPSKCIACKGVAASDVWRISRVGGFISSTSDAWGGCRPRRRFCGSSCCDGASRRKSTRGNSRRMEEQAAKFQQGNVLLSEKEPGQGGKSDGARKKFRRECAGPCIATT